MHPDPTEIDLAKAELPGPELHQFLATLRERGPVTEVRYGGQRAWLIAGYETLRQVFRDEASFPAGEWYRRVIEPTQGRTFESMDGPDHHLYRRLATPAFRSRAVTRMEDQGIAKLAHELLDELPDENVIDLVRHYTSRFPFILISRVLGIPLDREREFVSWALGILRFDQNAARQFTDYLLPVLAARRREPGNDVISELLHVEVEGKRLEDEEVLSHIRLLFSAGATTTHDALGNLLWAILTHREQLLEIQEDFTRLTAVIEEVLRWETPVAVLPRLCLPGTQVANIEIPPESLVLFAIAAANRDPAVFENPDCFDPQRESHSNLTFGLGTHSCPGLHMARSSIGVATQVLLTRMPNLRFSNELAARPVGFTLRGPKVLPIRGRTERL